MVLLIHDCIAGVGDVPIRDARRKLLLLEAATCASTSVVTQNRFFVAMRAVRSRMKEASPAKRTVIDMRQSTNPVYYVSGRDVKKCSAGWIT